MVGLGLLFSFFIYRDRLVQPGLRTMCPQLETVGFNGQASDKFAPQFAQAGYRTVVLPSSSPAHMAMYFEQQLAVWRRLMLLSRNRPCSDHW